MAKRSKKQVTKVKLADLLGKENKSNADFFRDDPERRKHHVKNRAPRNRLRHLTPAGSDYQRQLSHDPKKDVQLNELAREFIANGFKETPAIAAVFGVSLDTAAQDHFLKIFDSTWFRSKVSLMILGADGKLVEELPKEYLITKLINILEANILDYVGDDGRWLTVAELRALPLEMQTMLDDFQMTNTARMVALKDQQGNVVKDDNGQPYMVEQRDQVVRFKLPDKYKAMELLAKVMEWISRNIDVDVNVFDIKLLVEANERIKRLRRDDIEGTAERVAAD